MLSRLFVNNFSFPQSIIYEESIGLEEWFKCLRKCPFFILSIILFISVLRILMAPETMFERKVAERKKKEHTKKVGKFVGKSRKTN